MKAIGAWLNVKDFIRTRLSEMGASKHESEFSGDSRSWSRQMGADFLGRQEYEKGSSLAMVGLLARLYRDADLDALRGSPDFRRIMHSLMGEPLPAVGGAGQLTTDQLASLVGPGVYQMPDFSLFQNELKGYNEVVRWPLYSTKSYPTTGTAQLTFFDQSEGLATNGRADMNM